MSTLRSAPRSQSGSSMIEVLVTMVILLVGLLGLAGLQAQGLRSEMESYQRVHALILLQDMVGRINANRQVAPCYVTTALNPTYLGTDAAGTDVVDAPVCAANAQATQDMNDWSALLAGAAETSGGASVGAMIGARGCIEQIAAGYLVIVAWQGLGRTFANTDPNMTCGTGQYGEETQRRVVSLPITIATLL